MTLTRAPLGLTPNVLALCRKIRPDQKPRFLETTPDVDCEPLDCFNNVRRKIEREGGRIQFGWAIWVWPRVYIEAEHHAVYEPAPGEPWLDITPHATPVITRRLFLPDDTAVYDFANEGILRDNIRLALSNDPLIPRLFALAEERVRILNSIPGVGAVATDIATVRKLEDVQNRQAHIQIELAMKNAAPNDPCFCGSGNKFKRCHGRRH